MPYPVLGHWTYGDRVVPYPVLEHMEIYGDRDVPYPLRGHWMYGDRDVPYPVPATGSSRRGTLCSRGCHRGARGSARGPGHRWCHGDSSAPCPRSTMPAGARPGHHGGCCGPVPPPCPAPYLRHGAAPPGAVGRHAAGGIAGTLGRPVGTPQRGHSSDPGQGQGQGQAQRHRCPHGAGDTCGRQRPHRAPVPQFPPSQRRAGLCPPPPPLASPFFFVGVVENPCPPPLTAGSPAPCPTAAAAPDKPQHKVQGAGGCVPRGTLRARGGTLRANTLPPRHLGVTGTGGSPAVSHTPPAGRSAPIASHCGGGKCTWGVGGGSTSWGHPWVL